MALRQECAPALGPQLIHEPPFRTPAPPLETDQLQDSDEFEDAEEDLEPCPMDLQLAFDDCEQAMGRFFNNDVNGALGIMKPWSQTSLYHSLGMSIFEFIPAMLTFDSGQINNAMTAIKTCITICNQHRRNYSLVESIGTMIKKPNFSNYTDLQAHAELCYAEALLLQAAMTILEGEDLTGLIRATLKVKNCYNSYKDCAKILEKKQWDTESSKVNFQSGVRLGLATFNLMISLLPPKIVSLLEFVGFTSNKAVGLEELEAGSKESGLRSILCELTLLAYHLVICNFIGGEGDLDISQDILEKELAIYPDGAWFLLFKGRLEFLRGNYELAIQTYNRAIDTPNMWKQFKYFCYWEMTWVYCLKLDWNNSAYYAKRLMVESSWSRTIYSYIRASMLLQVEDGINNNHQNTVNELMGAAATYKQRIAGKSLPMEKFVIKRCARYQAQKGHLVLPGIELMCLWNMFGILAHNQAAAQAMLKVIEKTRDDLERGSQPWENGYEADNRALVRYLQACCLASMNLPRMALDIFSTVLTLKNDIKEDTFLLPYSVAEMAMCYHKLGDDSRALQMLQEARKKHSGYSLESRLHFRLHSRMQLIKSMNSRPH